MKRFILIILIITFIIAGFVSWFSSSLPDGLESAAIKLKIYNHGSVSFIRGLVPDYKIPGIKNRYLATSLAGITGALLIFILCLGFGKLLIKKNSK